MAEVPYFRYTDVGKGVGLLESGTRLLYGISVPGHGTLFIGIKTINQQTGQVQMDCCIEEIEVDDD